MLLRAWRPAHAVSCGLSAPCQKAAKLRAVLSWLSLLVFYLSLSNLITREPETVLLQWGLAWCQWAEA